MSEPVEAPTVRVGDPHGRYRRRLRMSAPEAGVVVADLEDDFHRFRVTLRHEAGRVLEVRGDGRRIPWTTCGDAARSLHALEGSPLEPRFTAAAGHADPRWNCTHMFDLAALAISHAYHHRDRRQYDIEVPGPVGEEINPRLWRDGELLLSWRLRATPGDRGLVDPAPPFDRASWYGGFMRWADATLDPDTAEAAIVLRRACEIGMGRGMDLDAYDRADELRELMLGVCYTMQPGVIETSARNKGSIRDFTDAPEALLHDS